MSDDNELTPEIEAALRDLPAADPALRDQHIAAALGELAPAATMKRRNLFAAAAAVLVLAGAGFAVSQNSDGDIPAVAAPDTTITSIPKASSNPACAEEFSEIWGDSGSLGSFTYSGVTYEMIQRKGVLSIYLAKEPCTKLGEIQYGDVMDARGQVDDSPQVGAECDWSKAPLARYSDRANGDSYPLVLAETESGVSLFFANRCTEPIGSIALPTSVD
jgi:hypothetical protein